MKMRTDSKDIGNRKTREKVIIAKSWFFRKINKIDKLQTGHNIIKKEITKMQILEIKDSLQTLKEL